VIKTETMGSKTVNPNFFEISGELASKKEWLKAIKEAEIMPIISLNDKINEYIPIKDENVIEEVKTVTKLFNRICKCGTKLNHIGYLKDSARWVSYYHCCSCGLKYRLNYGDFMGGGFDKVCIVKEFLNLEK